MGALFQNTVQSSVLSRAHKDLLPLEPYFVCRSLPRV